MEALRKIPLIGITADTGDINSRPSYFIYKAYILAVERAGGIPVLLTETPQVHDLVGRLDGLVISGGNFDISPALYGEAPLMNLVTLPDRTAFEAAVYIESLIKGVPVLGICGGCQLINVIAGGSLYQDIKLQVPASRDHTQGEHLVVIEPRTTLHSILGQDSTPANTSHHQAVREPGRDIIVSARAGDGVIEAIEHRDFPNVLGIQWHPERMDQDMQGIYRWLVAQASGHSPKP
jgi:putative glutamine amidotransferase